MRKDSIIQKIYIWRNTNFKSYFDFELKWINLLLTLSLFCYFLVTKKLPVLFLISLMVFINVWLFGWKVLYVLLITTLIIITFFFVRKIIAEKILSSQNVIKKLKVIDITSNKVIASDLFFNQFEFKKPSNIQLDLYENIQIRAKIIKNFKPFNNLIKISLEQIEKIGTWDIRYYFFKYFNNLDPDYKEFTITLLFGFNFNLENPMILKIKELGVLHLIVVSGLHYLILFKTLKLLTNKFDKKGILIFVFLIIYFWFGKKQVSACRAISFILIWNYFPKKIFKKNFLFSKYKLLALIGIINLVWNPFLALKTGFWITYFLAFYWNSQNLKSKKWKIYLETTLISLFINLIFNNEISWSTFLFAPFLTALFECILILSLVLFWAVPIIILLNRIVFQIINILHFMNLSLLVELNSFFYHFIYLSLYSLLTKNFWNSKDLSRKKWWIKYN
ncbi:ComEC/Rec2 family competence protein [Mycoplasmopsis glycophila]|uniref:ComEC/Rec2-related protein domain-containing protein n=1 Tax=Mycoplasmopsis glycophila TaxID=171285 RepID=A0A449AUR2_9BACT|nr:ComEC/Rec2 family competence protein [Mycoplasmopsis glycophila]VEU70210.1 Uncharacterised protein [Mycoplasmopsis glycophila]